MQAGDAQLEASVQIAANQQAALKLEASKQRPGTSGLHLQASGNGGQPTKRPGKVSCCQWPVL